MAKEVNIHWRRHDYRNKSLFMIIEGLSKSILELKKNLDLIHWYDADWLMEETEPIYGLAFIAFQNYIIGSVGDVEGNTKTKHAYYKRDNIILGYNHTRIELITALANYAKHQDEGSPLRGTMAILDNFNLNYKDVICLDEAPIFQGLTILNKDWNLFDIMEQVFTWRESLWRAREA